MINISKMIKYALAALFLFAVALGGSAVAQEMGTGYRGGMMGGWGRNYPRGGPWSMTGPGMMGGMMGGMTGMMGGMTGSYSSIPAPLSHEKARAIIDGYLAFFNNPDLEIDEFEEYSHNFYVSLVEKSTGRGAIEIIIDRYYSSYHPEPQSMMWNIKYGMMGGNQQEKMSVTPQQAKKIAQDFLDVVYPGTSADETVAYYGYYTIMTELNGKHYGMLSINGFSKDIWYHTWHGMFISEVEEHE